MALLDMLQAATTGPTGILSKFTGGSGVLSVQAGILQSRINALTASGTLQAKVQNFTGTLGVRLKSGVPKADSVVRYQPPPGAARYQ